MDSVDPRRKQFERRSSISSVFVAVLIGVAYEKMADPVQEVIHNSSFTLGNISLIVIFFFTSIRFFIGNLLHLTSERLMALEGVRWLYDLTIILVQSVLLIFLGGNASVEESQESPLGFFGLLALLYIVDVYWIVSRWVFGRIRGGWRREFTPWAWAILNMLLICSIAATYLVSGDLHSDVALLWLGIASTIAFIIDIVLIDYYKLM